jgi:hypothetical protein
VEPGGYAQKPMKVFGEYLCTSEPPPPLQPVGELPPSTLPDIPLPPGVQEPIETLLPEELRGLVQTYAFGTGVAPPCEEQAPLGRFLNQDGKYPHVVEDGE